jgi:hypothetical protein
MVPQPFPPKKEQQLKEVAPQPPLLVDTKKGRAFALPTRKLSDSKSISLQFR